LRTCLGKAVPGPRSLTGARSMDEYNILLFTLFFLLIGGAGAFFIYPYIRKTRSN
jgi:hypothetical protein